MSKSDLEDRFEDLLQQNQLAYSRQYYAVPNRRFRWDFVIYHKGKPIVGCEIQGGIWSGGRHGTGKGLTDDSTKNILGLRNGLPTMPIVSSNFELAIEVLKEMCRNHQINV